MNELRTAVVIVTVAAGCFGCPPSQRASSEPAELHQEPPPSPDWHDAEDLGFSSPSESLYASWCPDLPFDARGLTPTPQHRLEGRGTRWTSVLGGSSDDFPGPGALFSESPGDRVTLVATDGPEPVCGQPLGDALGHAVELSMTESDGGFVCSSSGSLTEPCPAAVQRALDAGALVVVMVPSADALKGARSSALRQLLARLSCHLRVFAFKRGVIAHLAVDVPADALLREDPLFGTAQLVRVRDGDRLSAVELSTLGRVARAFGVRLVVSSNALTSEELARHLVTGGAIQHQGRLPERLARALDFTREHPSLFDRAVSDIALRVDPSKDRRPALARAVGELERAGATFEILLEGRFAPRMGADSQERAERFEVREPSDPQAGSHGHMAPAVEGLLGGERFQVPQRNQLVHHLIADESRGGLVSIPQWKTGEIPSCTAMWYLPFEAREFELPCRMAGSELVVRIPAWTDWAVLVATLGLPTGKVSGEEVTALHYSGGDRWSELTVVPPQWPGGDTVSLSFPEFFRAGDAPEALWEDLVPKWSYENDHLLLTAENGRVRVSGSLRGTTTGARTRLRITNLGSEPLRDVEAMVCLSSDRSVAFPDNGHAGTFTPGATGLRTLESLPIDNGDPLYVESQRFKYPLTILESADAVWVMANAFEASSGVGGNGRSGGVCLHSRPQFGDIPPGGEVERRGSIWLARASPEEVLAEYIADPLEVAARDARDPDQPEWRYPCRY